MKASVVMNNIEEYEGKRLVATSEYLEGHEYYVKNGEIYLVDENPEPNVTIGVPCFYQHTELELIETVWMPSKPDNGEQRYWHISNCGEVFSQYWTDDTSIYDNYNCFPCSIYNRQQLIADNVPNMSKVQRMQYMYFTHYNCLDLCEGDCSVSWTTGEGKWKGFHYQFRVGAVMANDFILAKQCADWLNSMSINAWGNKND